MQTPYDWASLAVFAALVVLLLQRSLADPPPDRLWQYLPPAVGCALGDYLGNQGNGLVAAVVLACTVAYILIVLKPRFRR